MPRHCNWRDCQAWRNEGLEMSSTSNEAVKLFDASLSQLVGLYENESLGGLQKTVENMLAADNDFVMGHVFAKATKLMGGSCKSPDEDPAIRDEVKVLSTLAEKSETNHRERQHINAVMMLLDNRWEDANNIWEDILLDYPTDMFAIRFSESGNLHTGNQIRQRDSKYSVLPYWNSSIPLYSYLFGMTAFGEMETGLYDKAEANARRAIEINPLDAWASHALAHVFDHTGRYNEGIKFLSSTVQDWSTCGMLACHTHWHYALYYLEKGDVDAALHYYDTEVQKFGENSFQGSDRSSMLFRLEMEGVDVGNRWADVYDLLRPYLDNHMDGFVDFHGMMACIGTNKKKEAESIMESMRDFIRTAPKHNHYRRTAEKIGVPMNEAILAWSEKDYARAADLLLPIRYEIKAIGGSNAQRDVWNQLLIHSALLSPEKRHNKIARSLIFERKGAKDTPLTERLAAKALIDQDD